MDNAEIDQNNAIVLFINGQIEPDVLHNEDQDQCEELSQRFNSLPCFPHGFDNWINENAENQIAKEVGDKWADFQLGHHSQWLLELPWNKNGQFDLPDLLTEESCYQMDQCTDELSFSDPELADICL